MKVSIHGSAMDGLGRRVWIDRSIALRATRRPSPSIARNTGPNPLAAQKLLDDEVSWVCDVPLAVGRAKDTGGEW